MHTRRTDLSHREEPCIPAAEFTDHTHPLRVRRPDREPDARHSVDGVRVRAEHVPQAAVRPLVEEVEVDVADRRQEAIGILALPGHLTAELEALSITERQRGSGNERREQAVFDALHRRWRSAGNEQLGAGSNRMPCADDHAGNTVHRARVGAEYRVRRVVRAGDQSRDVGGVRWW